MRKRKGEVTIKIIVIYGIILLTSFFLASLIQLVIRSNSINYKLIPLIYNSETTIEEISNAISDINTSASGSKLNIKYNPLDSTYIATFSDDDSGNMENKNAEFYAEENKMNSC